MPTLFQSSHAKFRLVLEPARPIYGRDGIVGTEGGKTAEFQRYVFQVDDPTAKRLGYKSQTELVDALRAAATYNTDFWELGNAPDAQKPTVQDMLAQITDATAYQRVEKLRELKHMELVGDGEQGGHQREEILTAIDRALGILTEGKEGKRGAGKPQPLPDAVNEEAVARKAMTRSDVS
jgi:hypothetical protein